VFCFAQSVGYASNTNGRHHQCDTAEQKKRIPLGRDDVRTDCTDDKRQADPDWKRNREARYINRRNQQQIGDVEMAPSDWWRGSMGSTLGAWNCRTIIFMPMSLHSGGH